MDLGVRPARSARRSLELIGKWKIPILVAAVGIGILLLPTGGEKPAELPQQTSERTWDESAEQRMERILSEVAGAGAVRVMLTRKDDGETEYQTDAQTVRRGDTVEEKTSTVFRGGSQSEALVRTVRAPEYRGAVVVSQGADRPEVCLNLVKAVSSLTGLPSNRITVLNMNKS